MATSPKRWLIDKTIDFIARITPRCHDITRLLSQSMDRRLPLPTRLSIRLHFAICVWCKRYGQQLTIIRKLSHSIPGGPEQMSTGSLPEEARKRIKEAVKRASRPEPSD
jgi:hypothetical protein